MMSDDKRSLTFEKQRERFVWTFHAGQEKLLLASLRDLAEDPDTSFDRDDALVLSLALEGQVPGADGSDRKWAREDHECTLGRERYDH